MIVARVAVALLLVLAGCGGEVAEQSPTPTVNGTATEAPQTSSPISTPQSTAVAPEDVEIAVYNGDIPLEPEPVFTDVLNLTGTAVDAPIVEVESQDSTDTNILDRRQSRFRRSLGITVPENKSVRLTAYTPARGYSVHIYERLLEDRRATETTLAHEFVHIVQFQTGWGGQMWQSRATVGDEAGYDGTVTYYLVLEGAATYVQDRYERAHMDPDRRAMERKRADYANASALSRLSLARYHYGAQYVAARAGSPANLSGVHLNAPNSSEQVLHGTDDPIAELDVSAQEGSGWTVEERDRMGELFLRIALRTELDRSVAVDAAAGWGDDRKVAYTNGDAAAYAWVLQWDDTSNATEFEGAFTTHLEAKARKEGGVWTAENGNHSYRVERPRKRTVVVFLGNESFVRKASTGEENGEVVVRP